MSSKITSSLLSKAIGNATSEVARQRTINLLQEAVKDLVLYGPKTGRIGQMPRIPIPKTKLTLDELRNIGFVDSLIAVPERGQVQFTSYRHPLHNIHIHDHGDLFNLHIDGMPSMAMQSMRRDLPRRLINKLKSTIPLGVRPELGPRHKKVYRNLPEQVIAEIKDYARGVGHATLEGVPGYINWGITSMIPGRKALVDEVLDDLPVGYLKDKYNYTRSRK